MLVPCLFCLPGDCSWYVSSNTTVAEKVALMVLFVNKHPMLRLFVFLTFLEGKLAGPALPCLAQIAAFCLLILRKVSV